VLGGSRLARRNRHFHFTPTTTDGTTTKSIQHNTGTNSGSQPPAPPSTATPQHNTAQSQVQSTPCRLCSRSCGGPRGEGGTRRSHSMRSSSNSNIRSSHKHHRNYDYTGVRMHMDMDIQIHGSIKTRRAPLVPPPPTPPTTPPSSSSRSTSSARPTAASPMWTETRTTITPTRCIRPRLLAERSMG